MSAVLDTHAAIWYLRPSKELSPMALQAIRHAVTSGKPINVSAISLVDAAVAEAVYKVPRSAVPDMPDRIIAATALHLGLPLITRDQRIQSAGIKTIW